MVERSRPRVLLLTHNAIQPYTGGGILLGNLFHRFPPENLFFVHADGTEPGESRSPSHRLTLRCLRPRWRAVCRLAGSLCAQLVRSPLSMRRAEILSAGVQSCEYTLGSRLDARIRAFQPQLIYAWVGDAVWARLLVRCAKRYRLPYVIHFMDNHAELAGASAAERALNGQFRRELDLAVRGASRIFTISQAMGVAYERKFAKPFDVFHGLIDRRQWPWPDASRGGRPFTLVFTGSVERSQLDGLRDVAAAVDMLCEGGSAARLVLYLTGHYESRARAALSGFRNVEYAPHPDSHSLRAVLNDADMLVLAYGFDQHSIQYYRYSFATKVVPYMLSGRCILAYGPAEIEPISYLKRGGWAKTVCRPGAAGLAGEIGRLMRAPHERETCARAAYTAGLEEHDLESNAERFATALGDVALAHNGVNGSALLCAGRA
jgi:hypothetical protein